MGWTGYHATQYINGTVDRKAECDAYFTQGPNKGHFKILKSVMVGSIYYAAVQSHPKKPAIENDNVSEEPISQNRIWAAIFQTRTNMREHFNFYYKDMDETVGPYQCDCPESILKLLDPTDSDFALAWRKRCRLQAEHKKSIKKLPVGTKITFKAHSNMSHGVKAGQEITLQKQLRYRNGKKQLQWNDGHYCWKAIYIPLEYEVSTR